MARLILDTGVVVEVSRGRTSLVGDGDDAAIPGVVLAEYMVGLALDRDERRVETSRRFLDEFLVLVPVCDYDSAVAAHHADLMVHTRREGRPRGAHDLIIAATARATGRVLVTADARAGFDGLPGVEVRLE